MRLGVAKLTPLESSKDYLKRVSLATVCISFAFLDEKKSDDQQVLTNAQWIDETSQPF